MSRIRTPLASLFCALAFVAGVARASDNYPVEIQKKYMLAMQPDCTLCHRDDKGGTGTVVTLFGLSLQGFGAMSKSVPSLDQALDADAASGCDSDGDGIPDIAEIMAGTDPSDGPGGTCGAPAPKHGCDARLAPAAPERGGSAVLALSVGAAMVLVHRRRRRIAGRSR